MRGMIDRGFTTVRDTGGADWGIKSGGRAGPCARAAAVHRRPGDRPDRRPFRSAPAHRFRRALPLLQRDGVHHGGVRRRRRGAQERPRADAPGRRPCEDHDVGRRRLPLRPARQSLQFSPPEVAAAVEEAQAFGRYVCAHAYTPEAITRAGHAGVRTIEHGNLIDEPAAKLMAEKGMILIANLVAYYAMRERAAEYGMTRRHARQERPRHRRRLAVARDLQARRHARSPTAATFSAGSRSTRAASSCCAARCSRRSRSSARRRRSGRDAPPGGQARHARSPAPSPTSSSSTATRSRISSLFQDQGRHLA